MERMTAEQARKLLGKAKPKKKPAKTRQKTSAAKYSGQAPDEYEKLITITVNGVDHAIPESNQQLIEYYENKKGK